MFCRKEESTGSNKKLPFGFPKQTSRENYCEEPHFSDFSRLKGWQSGRNLLKSIGGLSNSSFRQTESCPSGRRCSTRNFLKSWLFAPLKKPVKSGVFSGSKIEYFVVLSVSSFQKFLEEMRNNIHGELSEWSKVQHSKCCVPKRNLGFESLTLRQKVQ